MRVDPNLLNCVVFLFQEKEDEESGEIKLIPAGTSFFVRVEGEGAAAQTYLVTARHNIDRARDPIYVRCNLRSGQLFHSKTLKEQWIASDNSDVSCLPFFETEELAPGVQHISIAVSQFVGSDATYSGPPLSAGSSAVPVALGDDLAFVGLFSGHPGTNKNAPVVRFGNIAAMPGEEIRLTFGDDQNPYSVDVIGYLVECKSWGGVSGSPVLWTATAKGRVIEAPGIKKAKEPFVLNGLLGLVSGHFDINKKADVVGDVIGEIQTPVNSGIAVVTPAFEISDLLYRADVAEKRN